MRRIFITALYIFLFWLLLPGILFGSAFLLDQRLNLSMPYSPIHILVGSLIIIVAALMLSLAILQFLRFGRELPISAMPPDRIIQKGLFAVWRHPIYLFTTLLVAGIGLATGSGGLLFIVLPVFVLLVVLYTAIEERTLVQRFGPKYIHYRQRTPVVIPRLEYLVWIPFYLLCKLLLDIRINHRERVPDQPTFIVVATHRSYLDSFFVVLALGLRVSVVTTFEPYRHPFSAFLVRLVGSIPNRRYRRDVVTVRGIIKQLRRDGIVVIYPEGERSWTGRTGPWKPEVLHLLKAFPEVPIVPVRIDGNYQFWPRWAQRIRRTQLTLTIMEPVFSQPEQSPAELEAVLRGPVEPDDSGIICRSRVDVRDITKVIYRCPTCRSFDALQIASRTEFTCQVCHQLFELLPDYSVRYQSDGRVLIRELGDLYEDIRITKADICPKSTDSARNELLSECEQMTVYQELDIKIVPLFTGRLELTHESILCRNGGQEIKIALCDIRSVTIESNCKLQVYDGIYLTLYQFTFARESALKWQDFFFEAIRHKCGFTPNR